MPMTNVYSSVFLYDDLRDRGVLPSQLLSNQPTPPPAVAAVQTFGQDLETQQEISEILRLLVLRCLALNPALRPTPVELVAMTYTGLTHFTNVGAQQYHDSLDVGLERLSRYWESDADDGGQQTAQHATERPRHWHHEEHGERSRRRDRSRSPSPDGRRGSVRERSGHHRGFGADSRRRNRSPRRHWTASFACMTYLTFVLSVVVVHLGWLVLAPNYLITIGKL